MVEVKDFHQYVIKVDGSGRLILRNRQFLCRYQPPGSRRLFEAFPYVHEPSNPTVLDEKSKSSLGMLQPSQMPPNQSHKSDISDENGPRASPEHPVDLSNKEVHHVDEMRQKNHLLARLAPHNCPGLCEGPETEMTDSPKAESHHASLVIRRSKRSRAPREKYDVASGTYKTCS